MVSQQEVYECLHAIKSDAEELDKISAKMLNLCGQYCLNSLTNIINYSLEMGWVPYLWKHAIITPLPKIENPTSPFLDFGKNCIPSVSILNNILPTFQSGFHKGFVVRQICLRSQMTSQGIFVKVAVQQWF